MAPEYEIDGETATHALAWAYARMKDKDAGNIVDDDDHGLYVYSLNDGRVVVYPKGDKYVLYTNNRIAEQLKEEKVLPENTSSSINQ